MNHSNLVNRLSPVLNRYGYLCKLIKRIDKVAIYAAFNNNESLCPEGYFTVFIRQKKAGTFPDGRRSRAQELFPSQSKSASDAAFFMVDEGSGL